jgi:hypothetical protein
MPVGTRMSEDPVTLHLPRNLTLQELIALRAVWPAGARLIRLRMHPEQWVDPTGLVGVACLIEETRRSGGNVTVDFDGCNRATYWERMGFFRQTEMDGPAPSGVARAARRRLAELRKVTDIYEVDDLTDELVSVASPSPDARKTFSHIVSELMNNVCQHSGAHGFSAAQHWPATGRVQFCIADYGCGLQHALARYSPKDDCDAVDLALRVGVTGRPPNFGQPHMRNRGVGLSCAHRLATANNGAFVLWSNGGMFSTQMGTLSSNVRWTGTLVAVTMHRDNLPADFRAVMRDLTDELHAVEKAAKTRGKSNGEHR